MKYVIDNRPEGKIVLLDPFPAMGHVQAFLLIAIWLKERGFDPVFLLSLEFAKVVEDKGFRTIVGNPFLIIPDSQEVRESGRFHVFLDALMGVRKRRKMKDLKSRCKEYAKIICNIAPHLVLVDDHYAVKSLFYLSIQLPVILVSTMTLPAYQSGLPPFQSTYIPSSHVLNRAAVAMANKINRLRRWYRRILTQAICLNTDQFILLREHFGPLPFQFDFNRCFGVGIAGIPVLVTYPRSFNFSAACFSGQYYFFGRLPKTSDEDDFLGNRLNAVITAAKDGGRALVYCSLGTVTSHDLPVCCRFFAKLFKVAGQMPEAFFIVNIGKSLDVSSLPCTPSNVSVFDSLPQKALLPHVDLMINHGGINSIKECIAQAIPMVVYPLSLKWDQPACGAKVVYLGLGGRGNIRRDSVKKIKNTISRTLLRRKEVYLRICEFKSHLEKEELVEEQRIERLLYKYCISNANPIIPTHYETAEV